MSGKRVRGAKGSAPRKSAGNTAAPVSKEMAALTSALAGRMRMMQRAGVQYGGKRDIFTSAGYIPEGRVEFAHYWGLYTRGDIAGRIVDMPAKTTWRTPPDVVEEDEAEGTPFTKAFEALAKRLKLWQYFSRVDRLSGVGRYAVLVIGTKGTEDHTLKMPLERVGGPDDVIYLSVYHEDHAKIAEWVTDPGDARFGMPKSYDLQLTNLSGFSATAKMQVHATRLMHVAEDLLEDDVMGRPRLERALNRLYDLEKIAASTGEAYWQLIARILQAKIDPTMEIDPKDLVALDEKMLEMTHDLRRQFYGQGVEMSWLSSETPDVGKVGDFYFSLLAGAAGIPKRILFGSETGELASTTDQATWMGVVNERQEQFAEPMILRAFIDRMIALGALPKPTTGEYKVVWPTLFEETDNQKAEGNLKRAQTAAALAGPGGNPLELVTIDADSNVWLVEREADEPAEPLPPVDEDDDEIPADTDEEAPVALPPSAGAEEAEE